MASKQMEYKEEFFIDAEIDLMEIETFEARMKIVLYATLIVLVMLLNITLFLGLLWGRY